MCCTLSTPTLPTNKRAAEFDARTQAQKFEDAARELGADEDEAAFKAKLAVIARQKFRVEPEPPTQAKPPKADR